MNTETTTTAPATQEKAKEPNSIMGLRTPKFFGTIEDTVAFLNTIGDPEHADFCPDFATSPVVLNGLDDAGNFDPAVYGDGTEVMFHVLTNRGKKSTDAQGNETTSPATIKAVIVTPVPTQDAVAADKLGSEWLTRIFRTQITKAACDPLRNATDVNLAAKDMPMTLGDFVTGRESSPVMETYDKLFRGILDLFKSKSTSFARANLNKAQFKKALESKAFALDVYSNLEDRGDKVSFFVMAIHFGINEAKRQGMDPTVFENWLATRDEKTLDVATDDADADGFDLDSLEGLTLAAEPEADASTEAPAAE